MYKKMYKDGSMGSDKYFCHMCDSEIVNGKCPKCSLTAMQELNWFSDMMISNGIAADRYMIEMPIKIFEILNAARD